MYNNSVTARNEKYLKTGIATMLNALFANGIYGIAVPAAMPKVVNSVTCHDARLLMNGSFGVRMRWMTNV